MVWAISIGLVALWALAMASSRDFGGSVHLLLGVAVCGAIWRLIRNRQNNRFKKGV